MPDWRTEIQAMIDDDLLAIEQFFSAWYPRVLRWASGGEYSWRADPEDVVQETLLKLSRDHWRALINWHGMEDDTANTEASLAAYLRTICENTARDLRRGRGRDRAEPLEDDWLLAGPDANPLAVLEGEALAEALAEAYAGLSASDQHVLWLRFSHDYTLQELAEQLGTNPNNAAQRAHRAEKRLHAQLQDVLRRGCAGQGQS